MTDNKNIDNKDIHFAEEVSLPPKGYIHTAEYIQDRYGIKEIFVKESDQTAIIERIQMIDWFDYVLNNVKSECAGCDRLIREYALINVMSIIEGILQEAVHRCYQYCRKKRDVYGCEECDSCMNFYSEGKDYQLRFKSVLEALRNHSVLQDRDVTILTTYYDLRNKIHLRNSVGHRMDDRIYKMYYKGALDYVDVIVKKCLSEMTPYYNRCKGYEKKKLISEKNENDLESSVQYSAQATMAFGMVKELFDTAFPPIGYFDEEAIHRNFLLACGGMNIEDRTIHKAIGDYVLNHFYFITTGLLLNEDIRQAFKDAVEIEISLEKENEYVKAAARREIEREAVALINNAYMEIIKENEMFGTCYTIDPAAYNDDIYNYILPMIDKSLNVNEQFADEISEAIDEISEDVLITNGFILSNWMYLIRAFDKNRIFMSYVVTVIEKVKELLNTEG